MLTMAMTDPTPMMIPSAVRNVRILFRVNARIDTLKMRKIFIDMILRPRPPKEWPRQTE